VKSKRWSALILVVVLGLVLAACGDDAESETTTTTSGDAATTTAAGGDGGTDVDLAPDEDVTLRVLVHQNPPMVEFMEAFNAQYEASNPSVTVDMSVVPASELATVTNTRLSANDIDVIDIFGFSNGVKDYMGEATPPAWQQLIDAGLLLDITDQPFVQNYDEASIADAGTYNGQVYQVNLGRVSYSGMFVNNDLLAEAGVAIPTTWSELIAACDTITAAGNECMTAGGGDGWPIFVGSYGLLGALYPDQEAMVAGLYSGDIKWNDTATQELVNRYQIFAQDMLEEGVTGLSHDAAPARYAAGDVAFMPTGVWQAPALEEAGPAFEWTYVPFPGSDTAADNQFLFGKYDQGWSIAANSPNQDAALAYVTAFSDPANYQDFVNAVGFLPTQPTATLETQLGAQVAQYLPNYRVGYEQFWVAPAGAGQWANGAEGASWFQPFNEWDDATGLANQIQADLEEGLNAIG
jgi:raffinose/stachyose/melibiose transport system substrate-binding protein